MKRKGKLKKILISVVAIVLVLAIGCGCWYYFGHKAAGSVYVYPFNYIGMTDYWGDSQESYGPVSTDRMQTVYLSSTQTVTEVYVQPGDTVQKGDLLMSFDTTLSDLSLERSRLEVEKLKLQLQDAQAQLKEIKNMVPMVIPTPSPDPEPGEANLGTALPGAYQIISPDSSDGSTQENPLICWLNSSSSISDSLLKALRDKAQELQANALAQQPAPMAEDDPTEAVTEPATEATEPATEATGPATEATEPATEATEPATEATEPTEAPTAPATEPTTPSTEPTEPPVVPAVPEVTSFYVVFKVTEGNMSLGQQITWQGLYVNCKTEPYSFQFFDASGIMDPALTEASQPGTSDTDFNMGSGYTASQIAQMRSEQEKTISDLEFNIKMAEADYKIMQTEVSDGNIYADIDGTVVSMLDEEEAKTTMQPFIKVSGGGGFYVTGSISELDKDNLLIGQEVTVYDFWSGMEYTGAVQSISDYPTDEYGYYGSGNPNVSYYPFTVFVDGDADLMDGNYVSIQYSTSESGENGIYLENPFLRTENGQSYVYVQGEDGLLEKRYVTTGKSLYGSYTEILSGLSETDLIAFPYGKNLAEGITAVEGDLSNLYDY